MKYCLTAFVSVLLLGCCTSSKEGMFTENERSIIRDSDSLMYVTTIWNTKDSLILRTPSTDLAPQEIKSADFRTLAAKMLYSVQSPEQDGVGIAAPQVGINKRIVAVCRLDKEGEPFEVYVNARLDSLFGDKVPGYEGCLSIAPYRGAVSRYSDVLISYTDTSSLETRKEHVSGYTARIFQHEIDHLDGVLYIDRADTVFFDQAWAREREAFDYSKK